MKNWLFGFEHIGKLLDDFINCCNLLLSRDVMAIPAIKQCIYRYCVHDSESNPSMEGLMNVMQSVFVVLQSSPILDESILSSGHKVFCSLFSQYFDAIPPSEMVLLI